MESKREVQFEQKLLTSSVNAGRESAQIPLEVRLTGAVRRRELEVHFQPQYDVDCGQGCGVEALARWPLPSGEDISPTVFIPMAERIAMIGPLGTWVLGRACEVVAGWGNFGGQAPTLSVNVSTHQINDRFGDIIDRTLRITGLPPAQLELEITESALMANAEVSIACCEQWRGPGGHIAPGAFWPRQLRLNHPR